MAVPASSQLSGNTPTVFSSKPFWQFVVLAVVYVLRQTRMRCRTLSKDSEISLVPGAKYQWPNGQGTEKFFKGRAASRVWKQTYGPVYQIWSGFKPEVVLTEPEHLREYYKDSDKHVKAVNNNCGWLVGELLGSCLGLISRDRWESARIPWSHPFSQFMASSYLGLFASHASEYAKSLPEANNQAGADTLQLNVVESLKLFPFLVVAAMLFGPLSDEQKKNLIKLVPVREDLFRRAVKGGINRTRLSLWLNTKSSQMLTQYKKDWRNFVVDAYHQSKKHGKNGKVEQLWEDALSGDYMTEEVCLQTFDEVLYANLDVTTSAVSWTHILVAQHPKVQDELRKEILEQKKLDKYEWEEYIGRNDTLLAYCVTEASRLRPILPFSNPESATEDKVIGGLLIPKNVDVIVDTHAINVENPFWINGHEYNPSRFAKLQPRQYRYHMFRFGFGPRQCLGKFIGDKLIRSLLAEMVYNYNLSVESPKTDSKTIEGEPKLQDESWVGLPVVTMNLERTQEASAQ